MHSMRRNHRSAVRPVGPRPLLVFVARDAERRGILYILSLIIYFLWYVCGGCNVTNRNLKGESVWNQGETCEDIHGEADERI